MVTISPISQAQFPTTALPVTPVRPAMPVQPSLLIMPDMVPRVETSDLPALPAPPAAVVAQAKQEAVVRQGPLAPLMADLEQALQTAALPAPVRAAAAQVLAQATPLTPQISGQDVAQAVARSGLFLEAKLAADPKTPPQGADVKAGLLVLREALAGLLGPAPKAPPRGGAKAPPPFRGGPTQGMAPAQSSLPKDAAPAEVGRRLADETDAALARQELFQLASLPDAQEPGTSRWLFETPFATPQGQATAQFEIEKDGGDGRSAGAAGHVWKARFSLNLEPHGPVHAQVALSGDQARVTLWAERPGAATALRAQGERLTRALERAAMKAELAVYPGLPPVRAPGAGQFVDRAT